MSATGLFANVDGHRPISGGTSSSQNGLLTGQSEGIEFRCTEYQLHMEVLS
jgi:hypothetical protein